MSDSRVESPAQLSEHGWRAVLTSSLRAMATQNASLVAAGIAFYMVWGLIPTLVMIVIVSSLLFGGADVVAWLSRLRSDLPDSFDAAVTAQLTAIAAYSRSLSLAAIAAALLLAFWSGMRGARALIAALNLIHGDRETRAFWHRHALALGICVLGGAFVLATLTLIVGLAGTASLDDGGLLAPTRWPILIGSALALLSIIYRYAPCGRLARWRWVTWGATASATIWVAGSALLSAYASHYTALNPLLGSLGMIMLFLFWCYLTVVIVLFGAQINFALERRAAKEGASSPRTASR
jgi:membrane protein